MNILSIRGSIVHLQVREACQLPDTEGLVWRAVAGGAFGSNSVVQTRREAKEGMF